MIIIKLIKNKNEKIKINYFFKEIKQKEKYKIA